MSIWTLYERPADHPTRYVARRHAMVRTSRGGVRSAPTTDAIVADAIEPLRDRMRALGLTCLGRHRNDELHIVESWI